MNIILFLFKQFFREQWFNTFLLLFLSLFINILQMNVISFITANIIQYVQTMDGHSGDSSSKDKDTIFSFFHLFMIVSIFYIFLSYNYKYFQYQLLFKLRQWTKQELVKILLTVNNIDLNDTNFPSLITPITRLSVMAYTFFGDLIAIIIPNFMFLLVISLFFIYKNIFFGIFFFFANLFILSIFFFRWEVLYDYNIQYEHSVKLQEDYLVDILNNMDKIIYRGQTLVEMERFSDKCNHAENSAKQFYFSTNMTVCIAKMILFCILFLSIGFLIHLVSKRLISVTFFITFFTILLLYRDKMTFIIYQMPDFIEFIGRMDSVLEHFREIGEIYIKEKQKEERELDRPPLVFDSIVFQDVSFKYKASDRMIFDDVSIDVKIGNHEIIGIRGPSGNGKSTFAKLLLKIYSPVSGKIFIDGYDISTIDPDFLRSQITYVSQHSKLFDIQILENIFYGCNNPEKCNSHFQEIMKYPKIMDLFKNIDFQNNAGSLGDNLSGGQKLVINIISGLINDSPILFLDEPTNSIDTLLKYDILAIIKQFKHYKKAIFIISHDVDSFSLFNHSISL
jgi:ABC-type multidrug transport system fused ATPase/permease subunit